MDRAVFIHNTLRDFVSHFAFGVVDDNIIIRHQKGICDFTLCRETFAGAGSTEDKSIRIFQLLSVHHNQIVGESISMIFFTLSRPLPSSIDCIAIVTMFRKDVKKHIVSRIKRRYDAADSESRRYSQPPTGSVNRMAESKTTRAIDSGLQDDSHILIQQSVFPTTWMVSKVCYKQSKTVLKNQTK